MTTPTLTRAVPDDARAVVRLRNAAAEWQLSQGIRQWTPGEVTEVQFANRARAGELYVVRRGQDIIAAVLLQWDDEIVWGVRPPEAGYIHGLVIDRRHSGFGFGRSVLASAETHIASQGRRIARLDCVESNNPLQSYYTRAGYLEVGRNSFASRSGWRPVTLFEKHL